MRVRVRIRTTTIPIEVGTGHQRLKWLSMVALQRYNEERIGNERLCMADDAMSYISEANVATGLMDAEGNLLPPNQSIRVALEDNAEVFALLQADENLMSKASRASKGTSVFLMSQGAAPNKCVINGPLSLIHI